MNNGVNRFLQRIIQALVVLTALAVFLAVLSLSFPLDVYAVGELAFIGTPTPPPTYSPPPNGTPVPTDLIPHTVTLIDHSNPDSDYYSAKNLFQYGGDLVFSGDGPDELEGDIYGGLFKYDGSSVSLIENYYPPGSDGAFSFAEFNGDLYFSAVGLDSLGNEVGRELFYYDGISVKLAADINPGPTNHSRPESLTEFQANLYFFAEGLDDNDPPVGEEFFKYNGTDVTLVQDINPGIYGSNPNYLTNFDNNLYFEAFDGSEYKVFRYDGNTLDIIPGISLCSEMVEYLGMLYFCADGEDAGGNPVGNELFRLNNNIPELVADLNNNSSKPDELVVLDGILYFEANGDLYSFDGNETNAIYLNYPWPGYPEPYSSPWVDDLIAFNSELFFYGYYYDNFDHALFRGLYRFDKDRIEFIDELYIMDMAGYSNQLVISAGDNSSIGKKLWKLDNIPDRETDTEIVSFSPFPVTTGESFSVEVSVLTGDGGYPTGIVDVGDGGGTNCQITLVNGTGSCSLTLTEIGMQPVYARYQWATEYLSSSDEASQGIAPLAPASIEATYRTDPGIQVSWDPVAGATFYKLYRAASELGVKEDVYTGTEIHFPDYGVGFEDYYYWVRACYDVVCSDEAGHAIGARQDMIAPTGSFSSPLPNGSLGIPRGLVKVNAFDGETGVQSVTFWIDKGSGWELLGTDDDGSDGWQYQFLTAGLGVSAVDLKVVIKDQADNSSQPLVVNDITLSATQTNLGGFEARGGSDTTEEAELGLDLSDADPEFDSGARLIRFRRIILME